MNGVYPPKRQWRGQQKRPYRPSAITPDDLRRFGIPEGESLDKSFAAATGMPPGARRLNEAAPASAPRPAAKPASAAPETTGRADLWQTVQRQKAAGIVKTTRVLAVAGGVLVNTSTRGLTGMSEALVFVPGAQAADFA